MRKIIFLLPPFFHGGDRTCLEDLKSRQINLAAIVGSVDIVAEAAGEVQYRFTFEETEDGTFAEDWQDIIKQLR